MSKIWIKICGVTSPEDAEHVARAGADAIGLNFVPSSPRFLSVAQARAVVKSLPVAVEKVGVFADLPLDEIERVVREVELDRVQLHGHEPPEVLLALEARQISAFQAVRVGGVDDLERATLFGGDRILVDAKVTGALGGTGRRVNVELVEPLARKRSLVLAGGMSPETVEEALLRVRPFGVDTASGVEEMPRKKSPQKVLEFVERARAAARTWHDDAE